MERQIKRKKERVCEREKERERVIVKRKIC